MEDCWYVLPATELTDQDNSHEYIQGLTLQPETHPLTVRKAGTACQARNVCPFCLPHRNRRRRERNGRDNTIAMMESRYQMYINSREAVRSKTKPYTLVVIREDPC
jgi:hypothetical protein